MKRCAIAAAIMLATGSWLCLAGEPGPNDAETDVPRSAENAKRPAEEGAGRGKLMLLKWPDARKMAGACNSFATALYGQLGQAAGNVFFSPSSIHTALSMTYAGARGETERQMSAVLRVPTWTVPVGSDAGGPGPSLHVVEHRPVPQRMFHAGYARLLKALAPGEKAGHKLHQANALWGQAGWSWRKEFLKLTRDSYGAGLREVDFAKATEAARKTINDWVEKQTEEKIKNLLHKGDLDPLTTLVLTNAIYFKGDWAAKFDEKATADAAFHVSAEETVKVPMMRQTGPFMHGRTKAVAALKLPYAGKALSMTVLLPNKGVALAAVEKDLLKHLGEADKGMRSRRVRVALPRFRLKTRYYLKKPLTAMGMANAFGGGADFSGMDGTRSLFIGKVIHQAFVDVNEEGTEAAAATAVVMDRVAAPVPVSFRADRPFIFLIRHEKTGAILFLGRVAKPTEAAAET
jgi:serpin B